MTSAEVAVVTRFSLAMIGIVIAWEAMIIPTLTDTFRQNLFDLRRALFLNMARGEVSADEPAYGFIRGNINFMLRFAERITFTRLIITLALHSADARPSRGDELVARIADPDVRRGLNHYRTALGALVLFHSICTSPIAIPIVGLALLRRALGRALAQQTKSVVPAFSAVAGRAVEVEAQEHSHALAFA